MARLPRLPRARLRCPLAALLAALLAASLAACSAAPSGGATGKPTGTPSASTRSQSTPAATPSTTTSPALDAPWPGYHRGAARTGYADGTVTGLRVTAALALDGPVYASPIVVGDTAIVGTSNNTLYGVRAGTVAWQTHLGAPVRLSQLACGNVDPLGVLGTPVFDPPSGLVLVVAELTAPIRHELVAVHPADGAVAWRRVIDPPDAHPAAEQQRSALAIAGGRVWVAMGGLFGDCGPYLGKVIGVPLSGQGDAVVYRVPTSREGGIWAPPGPVVAADGTMYIAVGNGESTSGAWDGSDSVVQLGTDGVARSVFAPQVWAEDNANDLDLGSMGPALLDGGWVLAAGKRGVVYLLRAGSLGGVGGQVTSLSGCAAYGGAAVVGRVAFLPCRDGVAAIGVSAGAASSPALSQKWKAPGVAGSPIVVGGTVLAVDAPGGQLVALSAADGHELTRVAVGALTRFATPAYAAGTVYLGTASGLAIVATG